MYNPKGDDHQLETRLQPLSWYILYVIYTFVTKLEEPPQNGGAGCVMGDYQAWFRGNVGVKFPCMTRLGVMLGDNANFKLTARN